MRTYATIPQRPLLNFCSMCAVQEYRTLHGLPRPSSVLVDGSDIGTDPLFYSAGVLTEVTFPSCRNGYTFNCYFSVLRACFSSWTLVEHAVTKRSYSFSLNVPII